MDTSQTAESFRDLLLRHRGRTRLTQRELAARAGANRRTIQDWEGALNYPSAERLRALIQALFEAGGLTVGREAAEARELWSAVLREGPRMRTPFDEVWLAGLVPERAGPPPAPERATDVIPAVPVAITAEVGGDERRQDWGDAPDVLGFVGRRDELAVACEWVLAERCRLVAVLGMGGIGKTSFTAQLAHEVAPTFQRVYWRSLRDALPASQWLADAIGVFSDQQQVPPESAPRQLALLLQLLRNRPCLLVLDNFETVLEPGQCQGRYRDGYAGYGTLLQAIGETTHQSCVVVASREAPPELAVLCGHPVRTLDLGGLGLPEGQLLLVDKHLSGKTEDWAKLIGSFGGNGLALKVVGESIRELFGGDISAFLDAAPSGAVFGGIRRLLAEQLERSSALELQVLRVLAVEREPVTISSLMAELGARAGRGAVLEAVEALRRRSLVERSQINTAAAVHHPVVGFTLQSVVLESVTDRLVKEVAEEIARERPEQLAAQPLIKAQAKDYVRHTQEHLIGKTVLQKLQAETRTDRLEQQLLTLLNGWRGRPPEEQGYGPGSVVNLLRLLRGDLRGLDLGGLALRQAYLAGIEAQDTSLAYAHLSEAVLPEAFNFPFSVALSGDGAFLAAATSEGEVRLWRVADRTPLLAVQGHTGAIYALALSADGRHLATGGMGGTVRLWSLAAVQGGEQTLLGTQRLPSGRLLATLQAHTSRVGSLALSTDGRFLASGAFDGTVRLWEAPFASLGGDEPSTVRTADSEPCPARPPSAPCDERPIAATMLGHTAAVLGLAFSADGRLLASGSWDGTVRLWKAPCGKPLATLEGHTGPVNRVALSADGLLLASSSFDGTIRLWTLPGGQPLATLQHAGGVYSVALSPDGRLLVSGSEDAMVRMWEVPSGQPLATLQGHTRPVYGVALSADGRLLASGSEDATVRLWESGSRRLLATLQGLTSGVRATALSGDGRLVASGGADGPVRLWEASSGRLVATLQGHTRGVCAVALSGDGRLLASGGSDGTVRLWDVSSRQSLTTLQANCGQVFGVALNADWKLLASGSLDGIVRLWEASSGRLLATLRGHTNGVMAVALSVDGRLLASGSLDGTVRLWERFDKLRTSGDWQLLATLHGHTGSVYGVALSADRRLLVTGSEDATVRLWALPSGQPLATLQGHVGGVLGVVLSADGRLIGSSSQDGTVRLWDSRTGHLLATLEGHIGGVEGLALSEDGRTLASGGMDGAVRLWDTPSGTYLRSLRSDREYERTDITGLTGITTAQRAALLALGAVEHQGRSAGLSAECTP